MKITIIGGSGKMGRWFAGFLAKDGKEVVITGRDQERLRQTAKELGVQAIPDNAAAVPASGRLDFTEICS